MSEDDNDRKKPTNGRRGRQASKSRSSSAIARPKAPQRPRVASRGTRRSAAEQDEATQPAEDTGKATGDKAATTAEHSAASTPDSEVTHVATRSTDASIPDAHATEKEGSKRPPSVSKPSALKASAAAESQDKPNERNKAVSGKRQGATRQRAAGSRTRGDAGDPSTSAAELVHPVASADGSGSPTADPMADLAGLAERSLHESLQSLRSVSESRTLSELLERQSQHMRLMSEIWVRQAHRSMEVFNAMLIRRRR